ncbi:leucine-rich repeat-containing protein 37B-like [Nycticebus coucang]|uniref:leucine-rich repeat-containing protein 37B-like n=1 Tax=Nycticebus coucang TaxID=9470 RepID=UPI00234D92E7|nr:leucine-rich repeat-containing protein 37B-like [Nycticebus coucang]
MSLLRLWTPRVLLTEQLLWLLIQAAAIWRWPPDRVQPTSESPGPKEPWSSLSSDLSPESPHVPTPPADPGDFDYLGSSAPSHLLASPQELPENLAPFPDTDSAQELPQGPDRVTILRRRLLRNKLRRRRSPPEVVPTPGWDQNPVLTLRPQLIRKIQTVSPDEVTAHQAFEILVPPLDSHSSKPTTFIVSPKNLKEDLAQHPQLTKVVGALDQFESKSRSYKQILQNDDYTDQSMDLLYPGSIPLGFVRNPEVAQEARAQGELSQFNVKDESRNPETPEEIPSSLLHQETLEEYPEEVEPLTEQQASAQAPQPFEQVEPSLTEQETSAQQPTNTDEDVSQPVIHHEVNVPSQTRAEFII